MRTAAHSGCSISDTFDSPVFKNKNHRTKPTAHAKFMHCLQFTRSIISFEVELYRHLAYANRYWKSDVTASNTVWHTTSTSFCLTVACCLNIHSINLYLFPSVSINDNKLLLSSLFVIEKSIKYIEVNYIAKSFIICRQS